MNPNPYAASFPGPNPLWPDGQPMPGLPPGVTVMNDVIDEPGVASCHPSSQPTPATKQYVIGVDPASGKSTTIVTPVEVPPAVKGYPGATETFIPDFAPEGDGPLKIGFAVSSSVEPKRPCRLRLLLKDIKWTHEQLGKLMAEAESIATRIESGELVLEPAVLHLVESGLARRLTNIVG